MQSQFLASFYKSLLQIEYSICSSNQRHIAIIIIIRQVGLLRLSEQSQSTLKCPVKSAHVTFCT